MFRLLPYVIVLLLTAMSLRSFQIVDAIAEGGGLMSVVRKMGESARKKMQVTADPMIKSAVSRGTLADSSKEDEKMRCVSMLTMSDFNYGELDVLYKLRNRRVEMMRSYRWTDVKRASILAIEKDVNKKIDTLAEMQRQLERKIAEYNQISSAKLLKLTKMYENMKPKDAARVFDEMDSEVLAGIVLNMKEARLAAIVSEMEPSKAKGLSIVMTSESLKDIAQDIRRAGS